MEWMQNNWLPVVAILYAALSEIIGISPLKENSIVQVIMSILKKLIGRSSQLIGMILCLSAMSLLLFTPTAHAGTLDVTLAWDASNEAAGYNIYYGTAPKTYTTKIDVKNVTSYKLTKLACNPCYFAATAYDRSGAESDYSDEISYARLKAPANFKTTAILVTLP